MFSSIINRNTRSLARIELSDEQIKALPESSCLRIGCMLHE